MGAVDAKQDYRIIAALNAEWTELQHGHCETVRRWSARHPALADCRDLEQVLASTRRDGDAVLGALISEGHSGDDLAARVVLQAMLGKVVRMASGDVSATVDDYVVAIWCRIRSYPLSARPTKIAANLALDALKAVRREHQWTARGMSVTLLGDEGVLDRLHYEARSRAGLDHDPGTLTANGVIATAGRLGLIDVASRNVLLSVYAEGLSGRAAADRHGTTPDMIRYRCSRTVRRLALHSARLAAAA